MTQIKIEKILDGLYRKKFKVIEVITKNETVLPHKYEEGCVAYVDDRAVHFPSYTSGKSARGIHVGDVFSENEFNDLLDIITSQKEWIKEHQVKAKGWEGTEIVSA